MAELYGGLRRPRCRLQGESRNVHHHATHLVACVIKLSWEKPFLQRLDHTSSPIQCSTGR